MIKVSRKYALAHDLKTYFTGTPCKNGHISERYTSKKSCVACGASEAASWRQRNPERHAQNTLKRRFSNPAKTLWKDAQYRAKGAGLEFTIGPEDVIIPKYCPVLGIELKNQLQDGATRNNSPSLDRIDNSKGYVKGNVKVISWLANIIKRNFTYEELTAVATYVKNEIPEIEEPL